MRILFDHGTPRGIADELKNHTVITAFDKGWEKLSNGALLKAAEEEGFDLLLTTDRRLQYQQNLKDRKIAIISFDGLDEVVSGTVASRTRRRLRRRLQSTRIC